MPRDRPVALPRMLPDRSRVRLERAVLIRGAVDACEMGGAGFPDHLTGPVSRGAGAMTAPTFDKRGAGGEGFPLIQ